VRNRYKALLALAVASLLAAPAALASTSSPLTWSNDCDVALDSASCERLTYIANRLDDPSPTVDAADSLHGDVWVLIGAVLGGAFVPMLLRELVTWRRGG
jgi:hypothetical protein